MSAPDILFKGIPRGFTRGYTAECLASSNPDFVVIPCVGSFSLARVALDAGVPASKLVCGDISLYSTAIGNAIQGVDWSLALTPEAQEKWAFLQDYMTDPISKGAAVLFMIRVLQYVKTKQTIYHRDLQNELLANHPTYILQLKEQLAIMKQDFAGLTYLAQDMWLTLDQYKDNPNACLLVNPPRYDGGYDRMFKGIESVFTWQEPEAAMFREKDYARLMDMLGVAPAYTLMYYATQGEDPAPMWGEPWRSVFADRPGNKRVAAINWIIANRSVNNPKMTRAKVQLAKGKYPIFDGDIKPNSTLVALKVEKPVGDYYRDLFIHKLPGSVTEIYVALLMDGYLMSIVGVHTQNLRIKGTKDNAPRTAALTFAFTVPHEKYSRLHKLTLMCAVSDWFWADVLGKEKNYEMIAPAAVSTTMLTNHPENKTARGILKLVRRELQKDGSYKLSYSAGIVNRTRTETITQWLTKFKQD